MSRPLRVWTWTLLASALGCGTAERTVVALERGEAALACGDLALRFRSELAPLAPADAERDLLFAAARADAAPLARSVAERAVLARALLDDLREEVARAPITPEDEAKAREALWRVLEAPSSVRLLGAHVPVPPLTMGELEESVANAIERATRADLAPSDFVAHAEAERRDEAPVVVRVLPPITADGRVLPKTPKDESFGALPPEVIDAARSLFTPGSRSGVVAAKDGYWILFSLETYSASPLPEKDAAEAVLAFVLEQRARPLLDATVTRVRRERPVVVPRTRDLLALAWG